MAKKQKTITRWVARTHYCYRDKATRVLCVEVKLAETKKQFRVLPGQGELVEQALGYRVVLRKDDEELRTSRNDALNYLEQKWNKRMEQAKKDIVACQQRIDIIRKERDDLESS